MNVSELIEKLKKMPQDKQVMVLLSFEDYVIENVADGATPKAIVGYKDHVILW